MSKSLFEDDNYTKKLNNLDTIKNTIQNIIEGDCIEILKTIKDNSIDIIITSPPYNIGIKYNQYKDTLKREEYLTWLNNVFKEIKRVLQYNGSFFKFIIKPS